MSFLVAIQQIIPEVVGPNEVSIELMRVNIDTIEKIPRGDKSAVIAVFRGLIQEFINRLESSKVCTIKQIQNHTDERTSEYANLMKNSKASELRMGLAVTENLNENEFRKTIAEFSFAEEFLINSLSGIYDSQISRFQELLKRLNSLE